MKRCSTFNIKSKHYDQLTLAEDPAMLREAFVPWFVIKPFPVTEKTKKEISETSENKIKC